MRVVRGALALGTTLAYGAAATAWIYGGLDSALDRPSDTEAALIFGSINLMAGLLIGRWFALLLPLGTVAIGIFAAATGSDTPGDTPLWFVPAMYSPLAVLLVLAGLAIRRLIDPQAREAMSSPPRALLPLSPTWWFQRR